MPGRATKWADANPEFERLLIEADWGSLIRFARWEPQFHLAQALGISQSALARLESSAFPPTIRTLARVAVETECILEVSMIHPTLSERTAATVRFDGAAYARRRADERRVAYIVNQHRRQYRLPPHGDRSEWKQRGPR